MQLEQRRIIKQDTYTISNLYVNGNYVCDVIEDKDRGLSQDMPLSEIRRLKVYGETAIPYGVYEIDMNTVSPKYSNPFKYKWAKPYDSKLPRLVNVPGFSGVLIHTGNTASDTLGCLIVGQYKSGNKVVNSVKTFQRLMDDYLIPAKNRNEKIILTIH